MNVKILKHQQKQYLSGPKGESLLTKPTDINDVLGEMYYLEEPLLLLYAENLTPNFFDLKSKEAGEVFLKLSNYRIKTVFVIPQKYITGRFEELVRETNKGNELYFATDETKALEWLIKN